MTTTATPVTSIATSADGTPIAFESAGRGPVLVLVDGALCSRTMGPSRGLSDRLEDRFTVVRYDRRGRGGSGPGTSPYAVGREVEDLLAVLAAVGGHAHVLGVSSGAALALEAARAGAPVDRLAVFEAPFILDGTHPANDPQLPEKVQRMVHEGRRGQAVATFLRTVGAPAPMVLLMRLLPVWRTMTAVAHTLPYDLSIVVPFEQGEPLPDGYYDAVAVPTLVLAGGRSPAYMRGSQAAIAGAVAGARLEVLPGQTHMVKPAVLAPVVAAFLADAS
jgi:pimeloyl-ACP methyl ester carboxylesterase